MVNDARDFVRSFREASPYIHAHRGRVMVLVIGGDAVAGPHITGLVHDLALLDSLGVRLVVVHGARPQIEERLRARSLASRYESGIRVTDPEALPCVRDAAGAVRVELEALLSQGLASSPMAGARLRVASGNFVVARPVGVRDGVDFGFTGTVRRVDAAAIRARLESDELVLIPPLGYSPTGEVFNLSALEVGTAVASELAAAKLIFAVRTRGMVDEAGALVRQITHGELQQRLAAREDARCELHEVLRAAAQACRQGVRRVHLLPIATDGALLLELFTRDGIGTMVSAEPFDTLRPASIDDVGGILELIQPLEESGALVRRSREKLEMDIRHFTVLERDGMVIACAALLPLSEGAAELACLAVHPDYRRLGNASGLYEHLEGRARQLGIEQLYVLTTQATHWFQEHGFAPAAPETLPVDRQALYNYQRNSKVLVKTIG